MEFNVNMQKNTKNNNNQLKTTLKGLSVIFFI